MVFKVAICLLLFSSFTFVSASYSQSQVHFNTHTGGYENIGVILSKDLKKTECPQILHKLEVTFVSLHGLQPYRFPTKAVVISNDGTVHPLVNYQF